MSIDESQVTSAVAACGRSGVAPPAGRAGHGRTRPDQAQAGHRRARPAGRPLPRGRRAGGAGPGRRGRCRRGRRGRGRPGRDGRGAPARLRMLLRGEPSTGGPMHAADATATDTTTAAARATAARSGTRRDGPTGSCCPGSKTRVLGISSGKGGVGKSSVTVNLAVALPPGRLRRRDPRRRRLRVLGPEDAGRRPDPLIIGDLVVPPTANGVRCLSMGFFVADDTPVIWRGPMLHKALEQFLVDAYWGEPDFLLVDMPPGTGDVTLSLGQYLTKTEVFVVTTPQPAAQRVAQRSAYAARKLKLAVRGVIENMSWFTGDDGTRYELFGRGGGDQLAHDLGVPLLGRVPLVPDLRAGGDEGVPIVVSEPDGEAAAVFADLASTIAGLGPPGSTAGSSPSAERRSVPPSPTPGCGACRSSRPRARPRAPGARRSHRPRTRGRMPPCRDARCRPVAGRPGTPPRPSGPPGWPPSTAACGRSARGTTRRRAPRSRPAPWPAPCSRRRGVRRRGRRTDR